MKDFTLRRISYSPGYGDMLGGRHSASLERDKSGNWTLTCCDREYHRAPSVTAVYAVSEDDVGQFEKFIQQKKVFSLENRPKSDLFVTDYSPWSFYIDYEKTSFGKTVRESCSLQEYRRYSGRDYDLIRELRERFMALRGEKLSEAVEEPEP